MKNLILALAMFAGSTHARELLHCDDIGETERRILSVAETDGEVAFQLFLIEKFEHQPPYPYREGPIDRDYGPGSFRNSTTKIFPFYRHYMYEDTDGLKLLFPEGSCEISAASLTP
jgi:hypothetical protein